MKIIKKKAPAIKLNKKTVEDDSPLAKARAVKQERRESGIVDKRRTPMEAFLEQPTSMRKAINANCYDCVGQEEYIKRIRYCNIFDCVFWGMRPYSKGITKKQCEDFVETGVSFADEDEE